MSRSEKIEIQIQGLLDGSIKVKNTELVIQGLERLLINLD